MNKSQQRPNILRRTALKMALFAGVFVTSTVITSIVSKAQALPLSVEDLLSKYADALVKYVFSNHPDAGDIINKVNDAIEYIQDKFNLIYSPDEKNSTAEAASLATFGDALNTTENNQWSKYIVNQLKPTSRDCVGNAESDALKTLDRNIKGLTKMQRNTYVIKTMSPSDPDTLKAKTTYVIDKIKSQGVSAPEFHAASLLSRYGYRTAKHRDAAASFIEHLFSLVDLQMPTFIENPNSTELDVFSAYSKKVIIVSMLRDAVETMYALRVKSPETYRSLSVVVSEDKNILNELATNDGISQIDLMEFMHRRINSNKAVLDEMLEVNKTIVPTLTPSLKHLVPAIAYRNVVLQRVVEQSHLINKLQSVKLFHEI
jgi:hypothetical protein